MFLHVHGETILIYIFALNRVSAVPWEQFTNMYLTGTPPDPEQLYTLQICVL